MKFLIVTLALISSIAHAQPAIWLEHDDTGCGFLRGEPVYAGGFGFDDFDDSNRFEAVDAETLADWQDCQVKGLDPIEAEDDLTSVFDRVHWLVRDNALCSITDCDKL